jgi:hypothetical protein
MPACSGRRLGCWKAWPGRFKLGLRLGGCPGHHGASVMVVFAPASSPAFPAFKIDSERPVARRDSDSHLASGGSAPPPPQVCRARAQSAGPSRSVSESACCFDPRTAAPLAGRGARPAGIENASGHTGAEQRAHGGSLFTMTENKHTGAEQRAGRRGAEGARGQRTQVYDIRFTLAGPPFGGASMRGLAAARRRQQGWGGSAAAEAAALLRRRRQAMLPPRPW